MISLIIAAGISFNKTFKVNLQTMILAATLDYIAIYLILSNI
jgi:hypothetical protein